jgi:hypothetical protein
LLQTLAEPIDEFNESLIGKPQQLSKHLSVPKKQNEFHKDVNLNLEETIFVTTIVFAENYPCPFTLRFSGLQWSLKHWCPTTTLHSIITQKTT